MILQLSTLLLSITLTSDDGQLGADCNLALSVLSHAFVDVLVTRGSERLDSEHGASALVKLNGLWSVAKKN